MENRIGRKDDESLYQPKIHSRRIRTLYGLKQATGKPMTVLLDQAIRDLSESYSAEYHLEEELGPVAAEPVREDEQQENWEEICEYRRLLDELDYLKWLGELEKITNEQGRNTT